MLGEEDANALMSEFPSAEADELVTRQFLRAEVAEVRTEIADLRGDMHVGIAGVRAEIAELRSDLTFRLLAAIGAATAVLGTLITVN